MKSYAELAGRSDSGVLEQVVERRRLQAEALAGVRHLVAVASGKGGVGKSTVALGVAMALREAGRRVAVFDADLNGPSQARLAGMGARPWVPLEDGGLALPRREDGLGVVSLGSVLEAGRALEFDSPAHGDEQTWRGIRELSLVQDLLTAVRWGELDTLILDLPPGAALAAQFAGLLGDRARFVLVSLPAALAHEVVGRSLDALRAADAAVLGWVENFAGYRCPGCAQVQPLFPDRAPELAAPALGSLAFDPDLARLCEEGWPPGSDRAAAARRDLAGVAEHLWWRLEEEADADGGVDPTGEGET